MNTWRHTLYGPVIAVTLLSCGCVKLWRKNPDISCYMLQSERTAAPAESPLGDRLWIDPVTVVPPYNGRSLVTRENKEEFALSYYSELLLLPAENFRNAFYSWFAASGLFKTVSISERAGRSHRLAVTVEAFYADRETSEAVLEMRVALLDEQTRGLQVVFAKEYRRRIPLDTLNARTLIRGYNEALAQILAACEQDAADVLK